MVRVLGTPHRHALALVFGALLLLGGEFLALPVAGASSQTSPSSKTLQTTLQSPGPLANGLFGFSVDSRGKVAIVGAPNETSSELPRAGNAYIFYTVDGSLISSLASPNPQAGGMFGWSVAFGSSVLAGGKIAIVGAPNETADGLAGAGRAYVFNATSGALMATLMSPNPQAGGEFGFSMDLTGKTVVIGAPDEAAGGHPGAGNAYSFNVVTGKSHPKLHSPDPQSEGHFGWSIGAMGSVVAVGSPGEDSGEGRAYVFSSKGALTAVLSSGSPQSGGHFGWSVSATKRLIAVGAPDELAGGFAGAGDAYVFGASNGSMVSSLSSPHPKAGGAFGYSVDLEVDTVLVGSPHEDVGLVTKAGTAYLLEVPSGAVLRTLSSPSPQPNGFFGASVNARTKIYVTGAPGEQVEALGEAGHAYLF
jgi:FG-GAP repeat